MHLGRGDSDTAKISPPEFARELSPSLDDCVLSVREADAGGHGFGPEASVARGSGRGLKTVRSPMACRITPLARAVQQSPSDA